MDKILYISNYKNQGGWSVSAENHIKALSRYYKVAAPHINIGQGYRDVKLGESELGGDICIQQTLPNLALPDGRFKKNFIVYFSETNSIPPSWVESINRFNGAIVSAKFMKEAAAQSGVKVPIHVVPIPLDTLRIADKKPVAPNVLRNTFPHDCIFYTVADTNPRKNLEATIAAFHLAFAPDENVQLAIKLSGGAEESNKYVKELTDKVKSQLRLYPEAQHYKGEVVVSGQMSYEELLAFHRNADVFVNTSFGEAASLPTLEAFLSKRRCIVPCHSAFLDYFIDKSNGAYLASSLEVPCMGATAPPGLHTAREHWWSADVNSVAALMREAYEDWKKAKESPNKIGTLLKELSFESVSKRWQEILSD